VATRQTLKIFPKEIEMKTTKMLAIVVLVLSLPAEVANADFTFGEPTNLGPPVNSSVRDFGPTSSADGLSLYFDIDRPGGYGDKDLWVTTRHTTEDPWGEPVNLGSTVNSSYADNAPSITTDGLSLLFHSDRPGGFGERDIWVTTRPTINDPWGEPVNLGPPINTSYRETGVCISADGLELYFNSDRPGGSGGADLWVATRSTVKNDWETPVNLGPTLNTSFNDGGPNISADGLCLFFQLYGTVNDFDVWMSRRPNKEHPWSIPVNLGLTVNSSARDLQPEISSDGSTLYFTSRRPGGLGNHDLWQASIEPVVDLNGDGIVDVADMCIMVDHWGEDYPLCDIGPMPWGDGIVDVWDLMVFADHLHEKVQPEWIPLDGLLGSQSSTKGLAWDGAHLWVVSGTNIYKIDKENGAVLGVLEYPGGVGHPSYDWQGLTADGEGFLWVVSYETDSAYKINPINGVIQDSWPTGGPTPIGIAYLPFEAGGGTDGDDQDEQFFVSDENGHVYLTETDGDRVSYDNGEAPWGVGITNIFFLDNISNPDHFYVTRFGTNVISIYDDETGRKIADLSGPTNYAKGITSDGVFLYVSDYQTGRVYKARLP